jgi:hypothetical protein
MYITNPETIPKKYACKKHLARFLIYNKNLPLLAREGNIWYFAKTTALEKALEEVPIWISVSEKIL